MRQHLCKRKNVNSDLSKRFSNKYCLLSWCFGSAHTSLLAFQLQGARVSWWCGSAQRCGLGWPRGTGPPYTHHPSSLHSLSSAKHGLSCDGHPPLPKESSLLLSPAQSVLGDYSWPQMVFGLLCFFFVLWPLSLFWTLQTSFDWSFKGGSLIASWTRLSFSYLEAKKKEIVVFYKAAAISKAYYLRRLKAQRNDSSVLTFKIQNFSLFWYIPWWVRALS